MNSDFNINSLNTFFNALTNIDSSLATKKNPDDPIEPLLDQLQLIIQDYGALVEGKKDGNIEEKSKQIIQRLKSIENQPESIKIKIQQSIDKIETLRNLNFRIFNNTPWPQEVNVLMFSDFDLKTLLSLSRVSQQFEQAAEQVITNRINEGKRINEVLEGLDQIQKDNLLKKIGPGIEKLYGEHLEGKEILKLISFCPKVSTLSFDNCTINEEEVKDLANSPNVKNVKVLSLGLNRIGDKGVKYLANSPLLTNVEDLNLGSNEIGDEGAEALANSPYLTNVRELNLSLNRIGDKGAEAFAKSPNLKKVELFSLHNNKIGDKGAEAFSNSLYLEMKLLLLAFNEIGDEGAVAFSKSPYLEKPGVFLWLSENQIGEKGKEAMSRFLVAKKVLV